MSHASSTITVVAGLIQQGGQLLVCQRRRDGAFALKWEFPGGKVEPGETSLAGSHVVRALNHPTGSRHQQRPGEIGGCFGEHAWSVADHHAASSRGFDVDIVEADREVADNFELWLVVEHLGGHLVGQEGQDAIAAMNQLSKLVRSWREITLPKPHLDILGRPQERHSGLWNDPRDCNQRPP